MESRERPGWPTSPHLSTLPMHNGIAGCALTSNLTIWAGWDARWASLLWSLLPACSQPTLTPLPSLSRLRSPRPPSMAAMRLTAWLPTLSSGDDCTYPHKTPVILVLHPQPSRSHPPHSVCHCAGWAELPASTPTAPRSATSRITSCCMPSGRTMVVMTRAMGASAGAPTQKASMVRTAAAASRLITHLPSALEL
jgi:hypothetical protein